MSEDVHDHLRTVNMNLTAISHAWDPSILAHSSQLIRAGEYDAEDVRALAEAIGEWRETIAGITFRFCDLQDALEALADELEAA